MSTRSASVLLTGDEAIDRIVSALDVVAPILLRRHDPLVIHALLCGDDTAGASLNRSERRALNRFEADLDNIRAVGHAGLIEDQVDGYTSALSIDVGFRRNAA